MCLILFAHRAHPRYRLVLAANRDEFFARPTAFADYWPEAPQVLGGRDLEKGGTWMGITREGRWAAVTNYRDGTRPEPGTRSRGELVARYLLETAPAQTYCSAVAGSAHAYHGFNLLVADALDVYYVSHMSARPQALKPGIYGLSNHLLDSPWPKVGHGKRALEALLGADAETLTEALLARLADRHLADEEALPDTGINRDWERMLSAAFIAAPGYGTRASSVLLIGLDGEVRFRERSFDAAGDLLEDRKFRFEIDRVPATPATEA